MGPHKNVKLTHLGKYIWHAGVSPGQWLRPTHQTRTPHSSLGPSLTNLTTLNWCLSRSRLMVMWDQTLQHSLSVLVRRTFGFKALQTCTRALIWRLKDVLFRSRHRHCISLSINFHSAEIESVVIKIYLKYSHIFGRLLIALIVMAGADTMPALRLETVLAFLLT